MAKENRPPIVNCHVHIFTGDHVPAFLARTIVPWPFYLLINIRWALRLMIWLRKIGRFKYKVGWKTFVTRLGTTRAYIALRWPLAAVRWLFHGWLTINVFYFLLVLLVMVGAVDRSKVDGRWIKPIIDTLIDHRVLWEWRSTIVPITLSLYLWIFLPSLRRLVLKALGLFWKALGSLPGKAIKELWDRYKLIIRFTLYGLEKAESAQGRSGQSSVFTKLRHQYPADTHFIVLPMDMEYMGGGPVGRGGHYCDQMSELLKMKSSSTYGSRMHPFIFIDPRRITEKGKVFLDWGTAPDGQVTLNECDVKRYLNKGCSGFKIYPALGYFPFDQYLLPLWLYAAQHGLPIMTHCIRGVIYFRGRIKKEWGQHPVFKRQWRMKDGGTYDIGDYEPMPLLQTKNIEFQENFTHPLNYLCLLNKEFLVEYFMTLHKRYADPKGTALAPYVSTPDAAHFARLVKLFGFNAQEYTLDKDLGDLKICFAHFGGEDEWHRYLQTDTHAYSQQLVLHPDRGLDLQLVEAGKKNWGRFEDHWQEADWYSIICSMMLQYDHVYADISYILHDMAIRPLLNSTLTHPGRGGKLAERVLFGTDFYVVRNHKSDKDLLATLTAGLPEQHFDLMARTNPQAYLAHAIGNAPA